MLKKLLILIILPFILCGCEKSHKEEIVFSSWGSLTEVQILNNLIDQFEELNPDIHVKFMHIPQNYFQKVHLLFASSQAPDVLFINNLYLPLYASHLENLCDITDLEQYYSESIKALSKNGQLLAVPRDVSTLVFYRNKSLIPTIPRNTEEFLDIISQSKNFGVSYERDVYFMFPYILAFNEDIYHPKKSLTFYKNLEGNYAPSPQDIGSLTTAQMFLNGQIGLYLSGRWMYPKIKETANFDWDVITFFGTVPLDASGWAIPKSSKHKDSAKKFVKFLSSADSSNYFLNTGLIVPARKDVAQNIDNKVFLDSIKNSKALEITKEYKKTTDKMNKEFFDD